MQPCQGGMCDRGATSGMYRILTKIDGDLGHDNKFPTEDAPLQVCVISLLRVSFVFCPFVLKELLSDPSEGGYAFHGLLTSLWCLSGRG